MTPSGTRGMLNDAVSIYFPDPALAGAFVGRWCIGYKVETAEGALRVREDEPEPRGLHKTPNPQKDFPPSNHEPNHPGVKIASLHASEERQWHVQLHLSPNQSTGAGDNSVEKRCPAEP